jgi:hypothetical protein
VDLTLDPAQERAVGLPPGRATLVLGEAGHGKTTVALHRLAHLARAARRPFRAAVVVPTEGLRGLCERTLVHLGADWPVWIYEHFARRQARRVFPDLPRRESQDISAATMRLKRDPAVASAVALIAERPPGVIDDDEDAPPLDRSTRAVRGDLQHLFGDRLLLEQLVARSDGRVPRHAVAETLEHTHVQFGLTGEQTWAHVEDRKRLVPVDRRSLDEGTPDADAGSIDTEDYAVLFAIERARAARERARPARPRTYHCLVVDEAQWFAPIELAILGRSLAKGGTLIVAGDADQRLDVDGHFAGWSEAMQALGCDDYERVVLDVSYRCPPEVFTLAKQALGETPVDPEGTPIALFASAPDRSAWLASTLERLTENDPRAAIAVLTRSPRAARRIADDLRRALVAARLVWGGDFSLAPGVDITTIDQVRGMEFDHVIVADASAASFGDDVASRRAMYVAITRARRSARLASVGPPATFLVPAHDARG